jgi:hypothetical protein
MYTAISRKLEQCRLKLAHQKHCKGHIRQCPPVKGGVAGHVGFDMLQVTLALEFTTFHF